MFPGRVRLSYEAVNVSLLHNRQDKADDAPAGIRSTALLFGDRTKPILSGFSAASMGLITYAGYLNHQGPLFYVAAGASAIELLRIVWKTDYESRESCWRGFVGCGRTGLALALGLGADYAIEEYFSTPGDASPSSEAETQGR